MTWIRSLPLTVPVIITMFLQAVCVCVCVSLWSLVVWFGAHITPFPLVFAE